MHILCHIFCHPRGGLTVKAGTAPTPPRLPNLRAQTGTQSSDHSPKAQTPVPDPTPAGSPPPTPRASHTLTPILSPRALVTAAIPPYHRALLTKYVGIKRMGCGVKSTQ